MNPSSRPCWIPIFPALSLLPSPSWNRSYLCMLLFQTHSSLKYSNRLLWAAERWVLNANTRTGRQMIHETVEWIKNFDQDHARAHTYSSRATNAIQIRVSEWKCCQWHFIRLIPFDIQVVLATNIAETSVTMPGELLHWESEIESARGCDEYRVRTQHRGTRRTRSKYRNAHIVRYQVCYWQWCGQNTSVQCQNGHGLVGCCANLESWGKNFVYISYHSPFNVLAHSLAYSGSLADSLNHAGMAAKWSRWAYF